MNKFNLIYYDKLQGVTLDEGITRKPLKDENLSTVLLVIRDWDTESVPI